MNWSTARCYYRVGKAQVRQAFPLRTPSYFTDTDYHSSFRNVSLSASHHKGSLKIVNLKNLANNFQLFQTDK